MNQINKQAKQKLRCMTCDDDVWKASAAIARDLKISKSAYVRSLLEADIKRRQLRIGHAKDVVSLRISQNEGVGRN